MSASGHVETCANDGLEAELTRIAHESGLDRVGICDAEILDRARRELHRRKSEGLSDTMQFTYRNPNRSTDPSRTLDTARSIFVGALSYHMEDTDVEGVAVPWARVAKYARVDHYTLLRRGLESVAQRLREAGHSAVVVADENHLVDREVAFKAGLGWFGKNANLLLPGAGSWFVLGSVITSAELVPSAHRVADGCGTCRRCIDSCPTEAIVADGVIDSRRCLAWLLQKSGIFPHEYRIALGDRLYGCDDCQESCPVTVRLGARVPARSERIAEDIGPVIDVVELLESDDTDLMNRFGRWYIPERNPVWVRRNALIILGNVASVPATRRVEGILERYCASPDPFLRAHTVWTAHRLGLSAIVERLRTDADPLVRHELDELASVPVRQPGSHAAHGGAVSP